MKLTPKILILYTLPFLITVLLILFDVVKAIEFTFTLIFFSIFSFGLPLLLLSLPYFLYFYLVQKSFKFSFMSTLMSFLMTLICIAVFIFGINHYYKSFEKRFYFSEYTTHSLEKKSLIAYKHETNLEGKINRVKRISGMKSDMNEGDMELTQKRLYMIEVVNKEKPAGNPSYYYTKSYNYERSFGKWIRLDK